MTIEALQDLQALLTTFAAEFEASEQPVSAAHCRMVRGWAEREEREIESAAIIPSQEELEKIRKWAESACGTSIQSCA